MLVFLLSSSYFTKEYRFAYTIGGVLDAAGYEGGFIYSLVSDSVPILMAVDSAGDVREVSELSTGVDKVRRLKSLSSSLWGNTGTKAFSIFWPDSVVGVNFGNDTVVSILPLNGDTAFVLLFVPSMSTNFYRIVLTAGGNVVRTSDLDGIMPDDGYGFGDMELISSGAIALAMVEESDRLYVASVNVDLTSVSWVNKICTSRGW